LFAGVAPRSRVSTALNINLSEDLKTSNHQEIETIQEKWNAIRLLSKEEAAATLEGEWKEAYDRFYEKYDEDMDKMVDITTKLQKMIEPPRVEKKTQGQRKRDAWALKQARAAARALAQE
jgi:gas vesicle protein